MRDICVKANLLPKSEGNVSQIWEIRPAILRQKVAQGMPRRRLQELYNRICRIIHADRLVCGDEAQTIYNDTLDIIEDLYRTNLPSSKNTHSAGC